MTQYVMRNCGSAWDTTHMNHYLVACDVNARGGRGEVRWSDDVKLARRFDDFAEVMECWRQQSDVRPIRDDGKPNRPLTAYSIEPVPLDEDGQPAWPPLVISDEPIN